MKKLITFSSICIITSLLFSSCRSNMSVTKRHYNNGYYIAHSKGKQVISTSKGEIAQVKIKKTLHAAQNETRPNTISGYSQNNTTGENNVIMASNEKVQNKFVSHAKTKQTVNKKIVIIRNPVVQINRTLSETKKVGDDAVREGLSLFWIVILVILILWAVGFLAGGFGLGGLINLLLLVALILFILWLIRII